MTRFNLFYSVLIGILFVSTIGFGIEAFYPSLQPSYPPQGVEPTNQNELMFHNRNAFLLTEATSLLLIFTSIFLIKRSAVIKEGVLLGGIFTMVYAILRSTMSSYQDMRFTFTGILATLLFALLIAHSKLQK